MISRLTGRSIVVTRGSDQATELVDAIMAEGGTVVHAPLLKITPSEDGGVALSALVAELAADDWIAVTSSNAARAVLAAGTPQASIASIGIATTAVFDQADVEVAITASTSTADGLVEAMSALEPATVLLPQSNLARPVVASGLTELGHEVITIEAYRNEALPLDEATVLAAQEADVVTFASPSAVTRYVAQAGTMPATAVCIGPVTGFEADAAGFLVTETNGPDIASMLDALTL